jgi:hypothetical protein
MDGWMDGNTEPPNKVRYLVPMIHSGRLVIIERTFNTCSLAYKY